MSLLARLLKAKDPLFNLSLKQLEDLTHRPGVDTALIGEIYAKAYDRAARLGLDPDFNGQELYQSLINQVKTDDRRLAKMLGGSDPDDVGEMLPLLVKKADQLNIPRSGWFLKPSAAKSLLKQMPPPQTMKRLGYTKIENMLAGEDLYEVYGALRFAEDGEWLNKYLKQYTTLTFKDFEHRKIRIVKYDSQKWGDIAASFIHKKLHPITHLKELGVVMVMPTGKLTRLPGVSLVVLPLLIHYLYEVRLYSAFFKLISIKPNFGELLVDTLVADTAGVRLTANRKIHWRVIQRYFGKLPKERHPEIFEPHVQPEDLHWRKAEEVLYEIDPKLIFWQDMDYVALQLGGQDTVCFNLMDVSLSYSHQLGYQDRYFYHFREALWNEIFARYLGQRTLEQQVLQQLDNELIAPEKVKPPAAKVNAKTRV